MPEANKPFYKLSATKCERYRLYAIGEIDEADLVATITRTKVWSEYMQFGTAYHAIIEHGHTPFKVPDKDVYRVAVPEADGVIVLTDEQLKPALWYRDRYPHLVHEVRVSWKADMGAYVARVGGIVDGIEGLYLHEVKTTPKTPKVSRYEPSCQWKVYLLATGAAMCQYDIFQYRQQTDRPSEIMPVFSFPLYPYPNMENDCRALVAGLVEFCRERDLIPYLENPMYGSPG